jgi:hypothetical protein
MKYSIIIVITIMVLSLLCTIMLPKEHSIEVIETEISTNTHITFSTKTRELIISKTATVTETPTKIKKKIVDVRELRYISASPVLNDNRIWAMKPIIVLDEGSQERCQPEILTGDIYQSNDGGYTWEFAAPQLTLHPSWCIFKQDIIDITSSIEIVPYGDGIIVQIKLFPGPLPSVTPILSWDGHNWYLVPSPIRSPKQGDPKGSGLHQIIIAPDGSGRIIAVGDDPNSLSNAWLLEKPTELWRDISSKLDYSGTITNIIWSYAFGLIGMNSNSILQWVNETKWIDLKYPKNNIPSSTHIWMGVNGEICTHDWQLPDSTPNIGWNGSEWKLDDPASNCAYNPLGIAYKQFVIVGDAIDHELTFLTNNNPEIHKLNLPKNASNTHLLSLSVSQTGIIYLLFDFGLYASNDIGNSWELVYS